MEMNKIVIDIITAATNINYKYDTLKCKIKSF